MDARCPDGPEPMTTRSYDCMGSGYCRTNARGCQEWAGRTRACGNVYTLPGAIALTADSVELLRSPIVATLRRRLVAPGLLRERISSLGATLRSPEGLRRPNPSNKRHSKCLGGAGIRCCDVSPGIEKPDLRAWLPNCTREPKPALLSVNH